MTKLRHLRSLLPVLAGTLFLVSTLHAQFNGPALPQGTGVNRPTQLTTDPALLYPVNPDFKLSIGDLITVKIYGVGDYTSVVRVNSDGKIQLPLAGVLTMQGLSIIDAEAAIAKRLVDAGMYRNPQVSVQVTEGPSASVTMVGEMHGVVPLVSPRGLLDILSVAGGLPATASHIITIDRPGKPEPIVVDLGTDPARSAQANIPILPGDTIVVSRVGVVYIMGAFKNTGAVPLGGNSALTLLQATALSGGTNFEGKFSDLRIIRTNGTQRSVVKVDIKKIMYGKAPDPVLQADDIIFLPDDMLKSAIKSGGVGVILNAASLFVNVLTYTKVN